MERYSNFRNCNAKQKFRNFLFSHFMFYSHFMLFSNIFRNKLEILKSAFTYWLNMLKGR